LTSPIAGATGVSPMATAQATPTASGASASAGLSLSSDAFLQLLVAQLKYQDPSSPADTTSFMQETAMLSQTQTMQSLSSDSAANLKAQQMQTATSMVGHTIAYRDTTGLTAQGVVSSANLSGTTPTLTVGGKTVALTDVQQVLAS